MILIRRFKRHYNKIEKIIPKLQSDNAFSLHLQSDGTSVSVRNSTPAKEITTRFIVLMRRFLNKEDALYLAKVWEFLKENFENEIPDEAVEAV